MRRGWIATAVIGAGVFGVACGGGGEHDDAGLPVALDDSSPTANQEDSAVDSEDWRIPPPNRAM
jgi:hypothetical protein